MSVIVYEVLQTDFVFAMCGWQMGEVRVKGNANIALIICVAYPGRVPKGVWTGLSMIHKGRTVIWTVLGCVNDECSQNTCTLGCKAGYYWQDDRCNRCPSDCAACSSAFLCSQCKDGLYLSGQTCLQCHSVCTTCTAYDVCTGCKPEYFLIGTTCTPCPSSCTNCTDSGLCTGCIEGFYFIDGSCFECEPTCTKCNSATECTALQRWIIW